MARRWQCPNCGDGINGPERPRKDDVRRYCLTCSAETGRLVERISPALERKRQQGRERSAALQKRKRERESLAKIDAVSAGVLVNGVLTKVRIDKMLEEVWRLPTRKLEIPHRDDVPELVIRRSETKDYATGRCYYGSHLVVTIPSRGDLAEAEAVVIHEAAHQIAYYADRARKRAVGVKSTGTGHGRLFRSIFRSLVTEWTATPAVDPAVTDPYEFHQAMISHLRAHPAP